MQTYNGNKNSSERYPQAILCPKCEQIVIAELEPLSGNVTLYDFEDELINQKVLHEHIADAITVIRVSKRVAAEKRVVGNIGPHDWVYHDTDNGGDNAK